jgi:hypothetical protein
LGFGLLLGLEEAYFYVVFVLFGTKVAVEQILGVMIVALLLQRLPILSKMWK